MQYRATLFQMHLNVEICTHSILRVAATLLVQQLVGQLTVPQTNITLSTNCQLTLNTATPLPKSSDIGLHTGGALQLVLKQIPVGATQNTITSSDSDVIMM